MHTRITLDTVTYELASSYAKANGITLDAAIGELIRRGQMETTSAPLRVRTSAAGFPVFPRQNRVLTSAMVKEAIEKDLG